MPNARVTVARHARQERVKAEKAALKQQMAIINENRLLKERVEKLEERCSELENKTIASNKPKAVPPIRGNPLFETAWEFYKSNREELVKKYCDKYVVISGNSVLDAYEDHDTAYYETQKTVPLGSFLIHHVTEEEEIFRLSPLIGT